MNPQAMMQFMSAMGTFRNNHPKFAAFVGMVVKGGIPEGTIIEMTVQKPGEDPVTSNMKVQQSDLDMFNALKNMK